MRISHAILFFEACVLFTVMAVNAIAQTPGGGLPGDTPKDPAPIEKLGNNLFKMGRVHIDTSKHEVTVPGKVTDASSLEFIASTNSAFRTYESALQLDTNGLTFNVAMILIGLDKDKAVPSRFHFDPSVPGGDAVDVWVEWNTGNETKRVRAEELLWDQDKNEVFPRHPWVYTGSQVLPDGRYRADLDGVIIGFVHDPASIIEWVGANGLQRFGHVKIDPKLKLQPGMPVTVIIKPAATAPKD